MPGSEIDRLNLLVVLDLVRRAFLEDAAVVHHRHIGRHPERDVEIVLDDDVADMRRQRVEDGDEIAPLGRRETRRRLVEQDEARRAGQRQRDFELALLAVAQRRDRRCRECRRDGRCCAIECACAIVASRAPGRMSDSRPRETPRQATKMLSMTVSPPNSWLI